MTYLLKKWWVYVIVACIALALSFYFLSIRGDKYVANATFMTSSQSDTGMGSLLQMAGQFGVVSPGSGTNNLSADKLIELMGTRTMIISSLLNFGEVNGEKDLLINHFLKMTNDYSEDQKFTNSGIADFNYTENELADDILDKIRRIVLEASTSENGIIRASVTLPNEELAKQFLDNLINEVSDYHLATSTEKEEAEIAIIQGRADSIKLALDNAEYNLSNWYAKQSRRIKASAVSAKSLVEQTRLDREAEILGQSYVEVIKGLELSKLSLLRQKPVIQIIDAPTYPLGKDEPNKLLIFGLSLGGLLGLTTLMLILRKMIRDALNS